jgi:mannose-1-phosphate guanylyltransferase/mannose-6-phosphate isomerase
MKGIILMKTLILAGGSGTRLFPLSREKYPKQFLRIFDDESLFQKTLRRALTFSSDKNIFVITNREQKFLAQDQAAEIKCACTILVEPVGKNTLPAIYYGLQQIAGDGVPVNVAVLPSDHLLKDDDSYRHAVTAAKKLADKYLVVFGIRPTSPHTGYGYIRPGNATDGGFVVDAFVEKPDALTAVRYISEGYLWNSGMFLFNTRIFFEECEKHAPDIVRAFRNPADIAFHETPAISVDYGLMEKTSRAAVVPLPSAWDDVGSFDAIYAVLPKNEEDNAVRGEHVGIDSSRNLVISSRLVTTIGVNDFAIIETKDAILIAPRSRAQEVKKIVEHLRGRQDERAEVHTTVHRPWGSYSRLEDGQFYSIKRITVPPQKRLSLQMHHHRSEHWVVVTGTAKVTIDGKEFLLNKGESTFVPIGSMHRLENPGLVPLEIIEVQIGDYIGEDDILRFDDDYGRMEE